MVNINDITRINVSVMYYIHKYISYLVLCFVFFLCVFNAFAKSVFAFKKIVFLCLTDYKRKKTADKRVHKRIIRNFGLMHFISVFGAFIPKYFHNDSDSECAMIDFLVEHNVLRKSSPKSLKDFIMCNTETSKFVQFN